MTRENFILVLATLAVASLLVLAVVGVLIVRAIRSLRTEPEVAKAEKEPSTPDLKAALMLIAEANERVIDNEDGRDALIRYAVSELALAVALEEIAKQITLWDPPTLPGEPGTKEWREALRVWLKEKLNDLKGEFPTKIKVAAQFIMAHKKFIWKLVGKINSVLKDMIPGSTK